MRTDTQVSAYPPWLWGGGQGWESEVGWGGVKGRGQVFGGWMQKKKTSGIKITGCDRETWVDVCFRGGEDGGGRRGTVC